MLGQNDSMFRTLHVHIRLKVRKSDKSLESPDLSARTGPRAKCLKINLFDTSYGAPQPYSLLLKIYFRTLNPSIRKRTLKVYPR